MILSCCINPSLPCVYIFTYTLPLPCIHYETLTATLTLPHFHQATNQANHGLSCYHTHTFASYQSYNMLNYYDRALLTFLFKITYSGLFDTIPIHDTPTSIRRLKRKRAFSLRHHCSGNTRELPRQWWGCPKYQKWLPPRLPLWRRLPFCSSPALPQLQQYRHVK